MLYEFNKKPLIQLNIHHLKDFLTIYRKRTILEHKIVLAHSKETF